ncbi:MAG: hypothetical protein F4Y03_02635 [Alphaproteobacteria bacterium]|nr:hypothetical protein [Alphaproteobacteria bacterium]
MRFPSIDARQRYWPIHLHEMEEGDYVIFAIVKWGDGSIHATMAYRPPAADMVYTAPLTTEKSRMDKSGEQGTYWWWNGSYDKPTCEPSFGCPARPPYDWHGWLRNGRWEAAE